MMTESIQAYLDMLSQEKDEKPEITSNGKVILKYLQENQDVKCWKAKDLAEQIGISSRGASGALRKLVNDGFCEKLGTNPVIYTLTDKGKNYSFEEE